MDFRELIGKNRYDLEFNGYTGQHYGILFYDYPVISPGKKRYDTFSVPGMQGALISESNGRENAAIQCTFAIISDRVHEVCRELGRWLDSAGILKFSDSPDAFYEVLVTDTGDMERELFRYGRYTVTFTVLPYEFMEDGQEAVEEKTIYNQYQLCMPLYEIEGEGKCTLNVNGNTMTANVGQNLTIDSRLMIAYRNDGVNQSTAVYGEYERVWMPNGENTIEITNGFKLRVKPRWGYYI